MRGKDTIETRIVPFFYKLEKGTESLDVPGIP